MTNPSLNTSQHHVDDLLDEAHACLYSDTSRSFDLAQDALKLATAQIYTAGEACSLRHMATCYMIRGELAEAMPYAITSLTLALENDLKCEGAYAYLTIGTLQNMGGNFSLAAETLVDGLELAQTCDDPTLMTSLHHILAGVYYNFSDYDWQIFHIEQALSFADHADDPPQRRALALAALGSAYLGKEDYAKALTPLIEVLDYAEDQHIWLLQTSTLNTLGRAYLGLAEFAESEVAFQRALEIATHHDLAQWMITAWINLADLYIVRDQHDPALACLRRGLTQAQDSEQSGQEKVIHQRLAETYERFGDYQSALDHHRHFHTQHDLEHHRDTQTRIQVMKLKYALDDARREVEFQRLRNRSLQNRLREHERTQAETLELERLRITLEEKQKTEALHERILERVAHKFGNPLAVINTSANLLVRYHDRLTDEKRATHQYIINDSVTRLNTMVADILAVLRRDTGPLIPQVQTIMLVEVCQEAILAAKAATRTQDRVQIQLHIETVQINASSQRLGSIIMHLLTNALKFSSDDVHLILDNQDNQLTITVTDKGIGIPPEEQDSIYDPFFRCSNLDELPGSGLGLTVVHSDVTHLGGRIDLRSTLDEGTTITVRLPLNRPMK